MISAADRAALKNLVYFSIDSVVAGGKTTLKAQLAAFFRSIGANVYEIEEPVDAWVVHKLLGGFYVSLDEIAVEKSTYISDSMSESEDGGSPPPPALQRKDFRTKNHGPAMFQMVTYITRLPQFIRQFATALDSARKNPAILHVVMSDRSYLTDMRMFFEMNLEAGNMSEFGERTYRLHYSTMLEIVGHAIPDVAVYLVTPTEEALVRWARRRAHDKSRVDESLPPAYEQALQDQHEKYFQEGGMFEGAPVVRIDGMLPFNTDMIVVAKIAKEILAGAGVKL